MSDTIPVSISDPSGGCSTLVELLRWRATHQSGKLAYTFLGDGETERRHLSYGELDRESRAIAAWLQSLGVSGERALLLYAPSLDFIAGFFGCLYAGVVAVPVNPPRPNRSMFPLQAILADAQAKVALTTASVLSNVERGFAQAPCLKELRWIPTDTLEEDLTDAWRNPNVSSDTLAFLQYTSGSTTLPKGVMVSHGNLMYNERMIQRACHHTERTIYVGWLPFFHDMGLIGNLLQPLYLGVPSILMSPLAFLQRPIQWLQAISRYKATTSGGPNFAYDLCARKVTQQQRTNLDLSSWTLAFNGAEPIRQDTLEQFATAFEPCGFRREAFYPCYGLAEGTLFVSGGLREAPPTVHCVEGVALAHNLAITASLEKEGVRTLVGCGQTWLDQKIVIVDPESLIQCEENQVGEIWVSGPSVAQGYWNRPELTERTFRAYLVDTGEGPFLRTGDLGFLKDGELFVTGRIKDLIIIQGRNLYPQDIELTVERCHPTLRPGGGGAFSIEIAGEERLVVVQEVEYRQHPDVDAVVGAIRQAVAEEHEVQVCVVVLIKPGNIPKTSSGKIQRRACRDSFLAGDLHGVLARRENVASGIAHWIARRSGEASRSVEQP